MDLNCLNLKLRESSEKNERETMNSKTKEQINATKKHLITHNSSRSLSDLSGLTFIFNALGIYIHYTSNEYLYSL